MQDKREIPVIVNKKIVIKCRNFHTLGESTSLVMALGNRRKNSMSLGQTCKLSNRSNRKVIDWSQLQCNSNSNRLKFFKCNSNSNRLKFFKCNSNRLKFYLLHLLLSIIFLLQFILCYFSEGGCRKMIT